MREIGGELAQRRDRAIAALEEFQHYFDKQPDQHKWDVIDSIETGNVASLNPVERSFVTTMRRLFAEREAEIKSLGLLKTFLDNYFPHMWKDPEVAEQWVNNWQGKRPMAGSEAFRKKRSYPTMREGMNDPDFKLVPAFDNPVDFVLAKLAEEDKSITAHRAQEELKANGDLKLIRSGDKPPAGWAPIDDRIFVVNGPQSGAVSLPEGANISPEDVKVFGRRELGKYYAPEPLAVIVNHALQPGIRNSSLVQAWGTVNRTLNMIQLGASFFHGLTTALNSSFSDIGLGLEQLAAGQPLHGLVSASRGMVPFASAVRDYFQGKEIQKVWDGAPAKDPLTAAVVEVLKAAGGQAREDPYWRTGYSEQVRKAWDEGNYPGVAIRLPFAALDMTLQPIMKFAVPRAKLAAFAKLAQLEMQKQPLMTRQEARKLFGEAWDSIDNRFGQLSQRNLLMQPVIKDVMNAVVGRPGWTIGTAKELGGGVYDFAKAAVDLASGSKPKLTHRMAYLVAMFIGSLTLGGLLNYILTGEKPQDYRDLLAPRDGGLDADGNPTRIILPTYLAKDVYSYLTNPLGTLKAKMAPAVGLVSDLATNRDFQNQKIFGEGGIGGREWLLKDALPYSVSGLLKNIENEKSIFERVLPFVGVAPAPKSMGLTAAQKAMADYQREHAPALRLFSERNKLKRDITSALRSGNLPKAVTLAKPALKAGIISEDDIGEVENRAKLPRDVATFRSLPLEAAVDVIAVATPKERLRFMESLGSKVTGKAFESLPPVEQDRIKAKLKSLHFTPAELAAADGAEPEQ